MTQPLQPQDRAEILAMQMHGQMLMASSQRAVDYPNVPWEELSEDERALRIDAIMVLVRNGYMEYGRKVPKAMPENAMPRLPGRLEFEPGDNSVQGA